MNIKRTELEKLIRQLRSVVTALEAHLEPIEVPPEIQEEVDRKAQARICLAWDHVVPEGERMIRGRCVTDYATIMARIRRGEVDETEAVLTGQLQAEGKRPGRKAAADLAAEKEAKQKKVAEDRERYKKRKTKAKTDESDEKPA